MRLLASRLAPPKAWSGRGSVQSCAADFDFLPNSELFARRPNNSFLAGAVANLIGLPLLPDSNLHAGSCHQSDGCSYQCAYRSACGAPDQKPAARPKTCANRMIVLPGNHLVSVCSADSTEAKAEA